MTSIWLKICRSSKTQQPGSSFIHLYALHLPIKGRTQHLPEVSESPSNLCVVTNFFVEQSYVRTSSLYPKHEPWHGCNPVHIQLMNHCKNPSTKSVLTLTCRMWTRMSPCSISHQQHWAEQLIDMTSTKWTTKALLFNRVAALSLNRYTSLTEGFRVSALF